MTADREPLLHAPISSTDELPSPATIFVDIDDDIEPDLKRRPQKPESSSHILDKDPAAHCPSPYRPRLSLALRWLPLTLVLAGVFILVLDLIPFPAPPRSQHPHSTCTASTELHSSPTSFARWTHPDILAHRDDWQRWLAATFPTDEAVSASFLNASSHLESNKLPAIATGRRGLVFNARGSDRDLHLLSFALDALRRTGCFLPVEVWMFHDDATPARVAEIENLGLANQSVSVRFADDERLFAPVWKREGDHEGYHIKFAAAINSGFEEIVMLDSDIMAIRNPEELFATKEYAETGALFWPDYWKTSAKNPAWEWTDTPCLDEWEQESGIIVLHKSVSWRPLLLSWYLNRSAELRHWHTFLFGDKDMFRFSWHAAGARFHMVRHHLVPAGLLIPGPKSWWSALTSPPPRGLAASPSGTVFCGVTMVQHGVDGEPFFFHNNLAKYLNPADFSGGKNLTSPVALMRRRRSGVKEAGPRDYRARYFGWDGYQCVDFEDPRGEMELVEAAGMEVVDRISRDLVAGLRR
ncbi:hypothetical protein HDU96_005749 [Phlyctochytrium bullatum]|nr:hypothetical protein HDU96_005749 [Phlyctochytrium bullatum]